MGSITLFKSGWCSHFSTECTKTKSANKAIAMRLGTSANTPDPSRPTTTGAQRAWVEAGANTECDAGAGEVYRSQSPGKVSGIAACKKSCENDPGCKSITFFNSGWCSHYSTGCTKTKTTNKAIAMRLGGVISSSTTKLQATTGRYFCIKIVDAKQERTVGHMNIMRHY